MVSFFKTLISTFLFCLVCSSSGIQRFRLDAVVLRALSDQEGLSSSSSANCMRSGQRTRLLPANVQSSSSGSDMPAGNESRYILTLEQ